MSIFQTWVIWTSMLATPGKEKFPIGSFKIQHYFTYQVFNNFFRPILIAVFAFRYPLPSILWLFHGSTTTARIPSDAQGAIGYA